jgi:hypothetical protein
MLRYLIPLDKMNDISPGQKSPTLSPRSHSPSRSEGSEIFECEHCHFKYQTQKSLFAHQRTAKSCLIKRTENELKDELKQEKEKNSSLTAEVERLKVSIEFEAKYQQEKFDTLANKELLQHEVIHRLEDTIHSLQKESEVLREEIIKLKDTTLEMKYLKEKNVLVERLLSEKMISGHVGSVKKNEAIKGPVKPKEVKKENKPLKRWN